MPLDRTQKKPHDYRLPPGRRRHQLAFAQSDRLTIDDARGGAANEAGAAALADSAPPLGGERAVAPPAAAGQRLLGIAALPGACLLLGLVLGVVLGTVLTSGPVPVALQEQAPAMAPPDASDDAAAAPDLQSTAEEPSAAQAGSRQPAQAEPDEVPGVEWVARPGSGGG